MLFLESFFLHVRPKIYFLNLDFKETQKKLQMSRPQNSRGLMHTVIGAVTGEKNYQAQNQTRRQQTQQAPLPQSGGCGAALQRPVYSAVQGDCGLRQSALPTPWKSAKYVEPGITIQSNYHPSSTANEFPVSQAFDWYPQPFSYQDAAVPSSCASNGNTYSSTMSGAMQNQSSNLFHPTSYAALF
jgi:hypothetical protein